MSVQTRVFFSYVHSDDDAEHGRILRLASAVRAEYRLLSGEDIEIFTDRTIEWGEDWRQRIAEALEAASFFMPVLTPGFFQSEECRKETKAFVESASELGVSQQILSIRYISVPDLVEDSIDDVKALAASLQYVPWGELRLVEEQSSEHRKAVNALAQRLIALTQASESRGSDPAAPSALLVAPLDDSAPWEGATGSSGNSPEPKSEPGRAPARATSDDDDEGDEPGIADLIADFPPTMEAWLTTTKRLTDATQAFSQHFKEATPELQRADRKPNAFAARVVVYRRLAVEVEPELQKIEAISRDYARQVRELDRSVHAIFDLGEMAINMGQTVDTAAVKASLSGLDESSTKMIEQIEGAAGQARIIAKLSRDMRPVLRRYEVAMRNIIDGGTFVNNWAARAQTL